MGIRLFNTMYSLLLLAFVISRLEVSVAPLVQSKASDAATQEYMARFVSMVLRHKNCLLYTRIAFNYGCHCGMSPKKCGKKDKPKDCLDTCCLFHKQCFQSLKNNCTGLEPYKYKWDEKKEEISCDDCFHAKHHNDTEPECHCNSCLCDKKFAECFVQYPCPKASAYLTDDECEETARNVTTDLQLIPM